MSDRSNLIQAARALERLKELELTREYEGDLYRFLADGWKYIDPAAFMGGWHLEAIAEHLQAVTSGDIRRLCINVPPRSSKSSICSVAWPAWTWAQSNIGPLSGPHVQFLFSSYAQSLSLRDSVKTRRLIESPWYQKHWGKRFVLTGDQNTKVRFENDKGGYRLATSVGGALTGEGAAIIVCDDPHNAVEMESELVRQTTLEWWDESLSTRLNDQRTGAYVVIMQRLHQEDLTGHIMTRESENWTWLMLPMEHELDRHCTTYVHGATFWEDPREEEGELLCPERFPAEQVEDLKRRLGPYAAAGQLQQSPVPRGGGIIKEEWWQLWKDPGYPRCEYILASLDTAYTEKEENDPSALTIWGMFRDENNNPRIMLLYGWQDRLSINDLVRKVGDTCTVKGPSVFRHRFPVDKLIIESKASGISVAQELHRLHGQTGQFGVELFNPTKLGDKIARVYSIQHIFAEGMVYVPFKEPNGYLWASDIIDQISMFPRGSHDDFVDSMSMAVRYLRDTGFALTRVEREFEVNDEMLYRPRSVPLYPV